MMNVIIATLALALLGLVLGMMIGYAAKKFAVPVDPRVEEITGLLPGANCGGCGYAGCADFAKAIVETGASPTLCAACSEEALAQVAKAAGLEVGAREKKVAVVYCSGDKDRAVHIAQYNGLNDCRAAAVLAGGGKGCRFGCIGLGSCARSCPFGSIEVRNGLAIVHPDLCRRCGICVDICPRKLIRLVPANSGAHIYCNSLDKPVIKRKFCSATCIACRKCVKASPEHFNAQGFLVRAVDEPGITAEMVEGIGCPTGALQTVEMHLSGKKEKKGAAA